MSDKSEDSLKKGLKIEVTDEQENNYLDALEDDNARSDNDFVDAVKITVDDKNDTKENTSSDKKPDENSDKTDGVGGDDEAVDEVVRDESDRLLRSDDDKLKSQFEPPQTKKTIMGKIGGAVAYWWRIKKLRYGTLALLFIGMSAAAFVPTTRYTVLNAVGVRVVTSMSIVDSQTGLPLQNIPVTLQGRESKSNADGYVEFSDLRLGAAKLVVSRLGYADLEKKLVLGWGSNPIGDQPLVATGTQFTFVLRDWLNGKPILDAEASSGEDIAKSDEDGKIVLTIGELGADTEAVVVADGYRQEVLNLSTAAQETELKLVSAKKHTFVSNRTGEYDLYRIDADGSNEAVLLAATGKEREIPYVLNHPTKDYAAYVSTRDGEVNSGGFIFDGLFVIDVADGTVDRIARSEQVQVIGWSGDKLVYTAITEGVSGRNPERSKIHSFDVRTGDRVELASSNYFNDVKLVNDLVYYSVSSFAVPQSLAKLFSVNPNGDDKITVVNSQVWTIVRASYDTLHFRAVTEDQKTQWFSKVGDGSPEKLKVAPVIQNTRYYSVSPDNKHALRVEVRDGKGVLLRYDVETKKEVTIQTAPGLSEPVYWLNDESIIYRVSNSQETADYTMGTEGGEPHKIADVIGNQSRYFR